jgi:hypothetical protein
VAESLPQLKTLSDTPRGPALQHLNAMQEKIHRPWHEYTITEIAPLIILWVLRMNLLARLRRQRTGTTRKERRAA